MPSHKEGFSDPGTSCGINELCICRVCHVMYLSSGMFACTGGVLECDLCMHVKLAFQ